MLLSFICRAYALMLLIGAVALSSSKLSSLSDFQIWFISLSGSFLVLLNIPIILIPYILSTP